MQGLMEQGNFYEHVFHNNHLLLKIVANYYEDFVYNVSPRLCHLSELNLDDVNLYDFIMQCQNLGKHEQYFCAPLGITNLKDEDFSIIHSRIALIPKEHLYHLVLMAGMVICAPNIAKIVSREDVKKIRELENIVPYNTQAKYSSAYDFVLQKAPMYKAHADHVCHVAEEDAKTHSFNSLNIDERIVAWGLWSVLSCVQHGGQNLVLRSLVVLDELCAYVPQLNIFSQHLPGNSLNQFIPLSTTSVNAWPLLRVLLFKEIACPWEEGWTTFFA